MKFTIFSFQERQYKKITFMCTLLATVTGIFIYCHSLSSNDPSIGLISFIVSIAYALALFALGLYYAAQNSKIENRFFAIKDHYVSLCNLQGLFSSERLAKCNYDDLKSFVLFHKVFTARVESVDSAIIKGDCFIYKKRYLEHETAFLTTHDKLLSKINQAVLEIIDKRQLSTKVPYPQIHKIEEFIPTPTNWIAGYLELTEEQSKLFAEFHSQFLKDNKATIKKVDKELLYVTSKNRSIGKKVNAYRSRIESIYGQRLQREIERDILVGDTLSNMDKMLQKIINQTSNVDSNNEEIENAISDVKQEVLALSTILTEHSANFETRID